MKLIIQRVKKAQVEVDGAIVGKIKTGMLIFLGVCKSDSRKDADYLVHKVAELRIFEDEQGKMNLSALDCQADFLVVSQFTLYGNCKKGRRPSFDDAADPKLAEELYEYFVEQLKETNLTVETGKFRAMMEVALINDGPVTFIIESEKDKG